MQSRSDENLDQTFGRLFEVIGSERFLRRLGLGNEVPFFVSAYHPSLQTKVESLVPALENRLRNSGISALRMDLYDLVKEALDSRGVWERLVAKEPDEVKSRFLGTMRNVTSPADRLVPRVAEALRAAPVDVLLVTGVGMVYPYIRSHNFLENLQSVTGTTPTVLFFPGDYSFSAGKGSYLKLFGMLPDDRYYRAFNIADFAL
jgi:hypothetical protein